MSNLRIHYDAGELRGEWSRGLLLCSESWAYHSSPTRSPKVTTDPGEVTCEQCQLKMDNHKERGEE